MTDPKSTEIQLADYAPFSHLIDGVHLTFHLSPKATRVESRIAFRPNPAAKPVSEMFLHGEGLTTLSSTIDGSPVTLTPADQGVLLSVPEGPFSFEAEVQINPAANTALEGLYMSNGMYCTQCEAEGFRRITWYPDRPDVMATFSVRVEGDLPVLLSNGNPGESGPGWAEWHDPWPKPAYLFALVAGDLVAETDRITTCENRDVTLNIWTRPDDAGKATYAMDALKRSMTWDEQAYGRAYDLDVFNVVAIDDFNMGAMENKGLNIFNASYVLASQQTATDVDYQWIESIIAHEYFHNWTGNRITCRDWFQLCLKEGLTVFRDQQFSADMRSAAVKRIEDVLKLRARQFTEDAGPLAHPVRPESFIEINNFYTATVYEKGAEVIRMLHRLVGADDYKKALDLYFERHDGDAATIEDWLQVFEDSTGRDLTQFKRWYSQAGTPRLTFTDDFKDGIYTATFEQETRPTPGQPNKDPQVIPIAMGLLGPNGAEVAETRILEMTETRQSFTFEGLGARPIPSILRGFSAPVILDRKIDAAERAFLLAHDTDPFNKWEAGRALSRETLMALAADGTAPSAAYLDGLMTVASDASLDPAFRALVLRLPSEDDIAQGLFDAGRTPDPLTIHRAAETLRQTIAEHLKPALPALLAAARVDGPYSPDAKSAGQRSLFLTLLSFAARLDDGASAALVYDEADNMTLKQGGLAILLGIGSGADQLVAFHDEWQNDRLVMDKWLSLQAALSEPEQAAEVVAALTEHPLFDWKNPNRFRALIGSFSGNAAAFHRADGAGYDLLANWLIRLDPVNPQTTARMTTAFQNWRRYDADRQGMMRAALQRILATPNLSGDTSEMVTRLLDG